MVALTNEVTDVAVERFIARAQRLVNGVAQDTDDAWDEVSAVVERRTKVAHASLRSLIRSLPPHRDKEMAAQGHVDFASLPGQRRRDQFFRSVRTVFDKWYAGILSDLGMHKWDATPWAKSLGLVNYKPGKFLLKTRDEVVRKGHELASLLDSVGVGQTTSEDDVSVYDLLEARRRIVVGTGGIRSSRITGRGLPRGHRTHSRTTSIVLRGLKGIIHDQEKALIENTLRGLDLLPRNQANQLYDAATGLTLRDALNAVADQFSVGEMSKQQLRLSIQTHIRAMVRRIAGESSRLRDITGVEDFMLMIPLRGRDIKKLTQSQVDRAFDVVRADEYIRATRGSGDSLGRNPGDTSIPIPLPASLRAGALFAGRRMRERLQALVHRALKVRKT